MDLMGAAKRLREIAHQKMLLTIQKYNQVKQLEVVHGSRAEFDKELARLVEKIKRYSEVQKKFKREVNRKYSEIYGKTALSTKQTNLAKRNHHHHHHHHRNIDHSGIDRGEKDATDHASSPLRRVELVRRTSVSKQQRNEITKEMFLASLGLVTREALAKLQTKSKERKRRSTANPNFSHEAIQAKRIVAEKNRQIKEKEKIRGVSLLKSTRQMAKSQRLAASNNNNNDTNTSTNHKLKQHQQRHTLLAQQRHQQMLEQERNKRDLIINEERELLAQKYTLINRIAELQATLESKQAIQEEINKENEKIKKRVSDMISTVNLFSAKVLFQDDIDLEQSIDLRCEEQLDNIF